VSGEDASDSAELVHIVFAERDATLGSEVAKRAGEEVEVVSVEDFTGFGMDVTAGS